MSGPLLPGAPVTLVLPDHIVLVEVTVSERTSFTCILSSRHEKQLHSTWALENENVDWMRGYHLPDSGEVKACRAAQALMPPRTAQPLARGTAVGTPIMATTSAPFNPAHGYSSTPNINMPYKAQRQKKP